MLTGSACRSLWSTSVRSASTRIGSTASTPAALLIQRDVPRKRQCSTMTPGEPVFVFPPAPTVHVPVVDDGPPASPGRAVPVHRVYCVAKNYVEHIREFGGDPVADSQKTGAAAPCFFTKPADAVVHAAASAPAEIPYALGTGRLDYEVELVVCLGRGGVEIPVEEALDYVYGYAVGVDLTRRDLQTVAKGKGLPWDTAKAFDHSAPISSILPVARLGNAQFLDTAGIWLEVNGSRRQQAKLSDMIWSVPEIISSLSKLFHLQPGDLVFTGTPSGVGPLSKGDTVVGGIDGLPSLEFRTT